MITILLVEDSVGDAFLAKKALEPIHNWVALDHVVDGEDALDSLKRKLPDLILLDWNLPNISGQDLLQTVKTTEEWKHVPVVVFTTSSAEEDVIRAYTNYANAYLVKPIDLNAFTNVLQTLGLFWALVATTV